ncbi:GabA permease [Verticillium alfalfae VaMs.102]|uniref:GabA permease n=1 Tax=Verticillium alfalfae (strain VaMs.102 / ATCC MYA-4576 / FGSC 10136) TaxID=526221 RepID=C9SVW4_VERA1|nr:GabA permease [Verticillium alfalfae VaMs.102]EEY22929.1 GabA permease [Verticillium alfalfae VaMs.102]
MSTSPAASSSNKPTMEKTEQAGEVTADQALAQLGYTAELPRNMGMLSILGLSIAIMSVPLGISTTMYISLTDGQSVTALYGWLLVSIVSLCTAASMAEICAVYPTAGGVYYWSVVLSTRQWAPLANKVVGGYTMIGYGMVASMCEEVPNPHREVPKGLVLSVLAAGITGLVYLIPILFVLPEVSLLLSVANGQPIGLLFKIVTGSAAGGFGLLFLLLGILLFAGVGAITAASRITYAFARDKAIPGHHIWSRVDRRLGVPVWSLTLTAAVNALLACIYFGSSAAFNSFTGVCTVCLSTSYGLPVFVSVLRGRRAVANSPFSLGRLGLSINMICIIWIAFSMVIFCMPVALPVDASTMNYASVVFAGFAGVSLLWYLAYGRQHFHGPPLLEGDL